MPTEHWGERLRRFRVAQNMTQRELAERADTRSMTVSEYELGKRSQPDKAIIERLAGALGVDPGAILFDVGDDTALEAPGYREWAGEGESSGATDSERAVLRRWGQVAAAEGYGLRPAAYSAALVILRTYGRPATTR